MFLRQIKVALCMLGALLAAWGCTSKPEFVAKPEPWRAEDEQACLSSGIVRESAFVHSRATLGGPEACGAIHPFEMSAAAGGRVQMRPAAMLRCPMIPAIERWVQTVVEPAAMYYFRAPLAELRVAASYACRPINHVNGARLSEHGLANALDVSEFLLADGRQIAVKTGWHGEPAERAFLRDVHQGGCRHFTTVLGPNADGNHRDHFHLDLARHGRDGEMRICR
jgi:hypothetical protein